VEGNEPVYIELRCAGVLRRDQEASRAAGTVFRTIRRAQAVEAAGREPQSLTPITLHECRHTFASLLIDAGANPKAVQTFMGHSKIQTTFDIYGHLLPGSHDEVRERMDVYLAVDIGSPAS
jgi:integrase